MNDAIAVFFCFLGGFAFVVAWKVLSDRHRVTSLKNHTPHETEERGGPLFWLAALVGMLVFQIFPEGKSEGPIGWVFAFLVLATLGAFFLWAGFYIGFQ